MERYHSPPSATIAATLGQGLDVVDQRRIGPAVAAIVQRAAGGPAHLRARGEQPVHVGREQAGQGVLALDDLQQRLLLAEEVLLGSRNHPELEPRQPAGFGHLGRRGGDARCYLGERGP